MSDTNSVETLGEAWQTLKQAFATFKSRPSPRPPFIGPVTAAAGDALQAGATFAPDASYFSVRLVEMRLAKGGEYFKTYLPMGVCVVEYTFGAERRRIPLVLSNETVQAMLGDVKGEVGAVKFTDMPVIRRAPVKEDNLTLFVGLFRIPFSDVAKSVLQLAADVSDEVGAAAFGSGAKLATKLYDRVSSLFKLNAVEARFAYLDGQALKKSGYVLVSGPLPKDVDPEDFVVQNSRLGLRPGAKTTPEALDTIDYCLVAIEQRSSLFETNAELRQLAALPFHAHWRKVTTLLTEQKAAEAEQALLKLRSEVVTSPDLTEEDRLLAIAGYDVSYTKYAQSLLAKAGAAVPVTRGFRNGTTTTGLQMQATSRATSDAATAAALDAMIFDLKRPPPGTAGTPSADDADKLLAQTIAALRGPLTKAVAGGAKAVVLADALSAGAAISKAA
jgi:hypothetical protein